MSATVCLAPTKTLSYPEGGGHLWAYLQWALGLRALGWQVLWLERVPADDSPQRVQSLVASLKDRLAPYGLGNCLTLYSGTAERLPPGIGAESLDLESATQADLLLNFQYDMPAAIVERFRRSALVDIDPGLLQVWMSRAQIHVAPHDVYFTIGETVGQPGVGFPDAGLAWHYTPPCVALDWWPPQPAGSDARFTTVTHWYAGEHVDDGGGCYPNQKRFGFLALLDLPQRTAQPLELAIDCAANDDRRTLLNHGWHLRPAHVVAATPWDYQRYIQSSRGEFSCAKPSCLRLQNAWVSDRTLCYLASGKPVVVQDTGPSRLLPQAAGMFRFRDGDDAVRHLEAVAADYDQQCRLARALAEEVFDTRKVLTRLLERALM